MAAIDIPPAADVTDAWEQYQAHTLAIRDNPALLDDNDYMKRGRALHHRFWSMMVDEAPAKAVGL